MSEKVVVNEKTPPLTLDDFSSARQLLAPIIHNTPLESSAFLSDFSGATVFLKCENLQKTGSYKIRGAYHRLSRLSVTDRERGVVAASAGNHAQGVAFAARELGVKATIFMPLGVAIPKLEATKAYGANVVLAGKVIQETLEAAETFSHTTGAILIPPFNHRDVISGQGTLAFELFEQIPELDTIIVPLGGGGLASGVASCAKLLAAQRGKNIRVIAVQAENAAPYPVSLKHGKVMPVPVVPTIADGIAVYQPGEINFEIIRDTVDEVVTVSDDDIARALLILLERSKLVVEPAGAVAVAALLTKRFTNLGKTALILSGGNIDPLLMQRVIAHGLAASERYLTLKIGLPDRPGQLATISTLLASVHANVIEVLHTRHGSDLQISEVELQLSVETRGPEHSSIVIEALEKAGFVVRVS